MLNFKTRNCLMSFIDFTYIASLQVVEEEKKEETLLSMDLESVDSLELHKEDVVSTAARGGAAW